MPQGVALRALMGAGAPADNSAWDVIDVVELGSAAASITFSDLSGYRLLRVTGYVLKDGTGANLLVRLNADTGANYDAQFLTGNSTSVVASRTTGGTSILGSQLAANTPATFEITIGKQLSGVPAMLLAPVVNSPVGDVSTRDWASRWNNTTDLITSLTLLNGSGNFAASTVCVLEGVPDA